MVAGIIAFFKLPVSPLPDVDIPTIMVQSDAARRQPGRRGGRPSASRWSAISARSPSVTEMTSSRRSAPRASRLQFDIDRDINGAARDVQAAINAARADLPTNAARQSDLPQVQPGLGADPDLHPDLGYADAGRAL